MSCHRCPTRSNLRPCSLAQVVEDKLVSLASHHRIPFHHWSNAWQFVAHDISGCCRRIRSTRPNLHTCNLGLSLDTEADHRSAALLTYPCTERRHVPRAQVPNVSGPANLHHRTSDTPASHSIAPASSPGWLAVCIPLSPSTLHCMAIHPRLLAAPQTWSEFSGHNCHASHIRPKQSTGRGCNPHQPCHQAHSAWSQPGGHHTICHTHCW
mmetsp:Transcript_56343/g.111978  ORF Transcript_56343/g.111978 Transcript_56343/m.111978 type:complete len:210 (-) Transcript_56343:329-958(-)